VHKDHNYEFNTAAMPSYPTHQQQEDKKSVDLKALRLMAGKV
jgi:hypothetical protein